MSGKPCEHLKKMCRTGCSFAEETDKCPRYEPEGRLKIVYLPVDRVDPRPGNRAIGDVTELAASIRAEGIHTPLTVCPHVDGIEGRWTAVAGNRRHAAAKAAGLSEVPCIIREMTHRERITMMLSENTQRKDMTPVEEADAMQQLMLELPGGNAAAVARETGISETTVRRRLKLMELDRDGLERAQARGGTLGDYEKLCEIKDPVRRNRVLAAIGTKDFDRTFQLQKSGDEDDAALARLVKALEKKGAVRLTELERRLRSDLSNEKTIHSWQLKGASVGMLDRDEEWYYTAEDREIRIYKVRKSEPGPDEAAEKTLEQLAREELERVTADVKEQLEGLMQEAIQMEQDFLNLREGFVEKYSTFQRGREEIMEVAVRALIGCGYWSGDRLEELGNWLGVTDIRDDEALGRCVRANPEKALLYTAYCALEKDVPHGGWTGRYNYYCGAEYPKHRANEPKTERLYQCLRLLGYEESSDEQSARAGTLPLYSRAEGLIADHKEVKRDLEKRIKR